MTNSTGPDRRRTARRPFFSVAGRALTVSLIYLSLCVSGFAQIGGPCGVRKTGAAATTTWPPARLSEQAFREGERNSRGGRFRDLVAADVVVTPEEAKP